MPWLDYQLEDFLLFSPDAYWRLFELANQASWPLPPLFPLIVVLVLAASRWLRPAAPYLVAGLIVLAWLWCGVFFMRHWYKPINWFASYIEPVFYVQALLLLWTSVMRRQFRDVIASGPRRVAGSVLLLGALLLYPVAGVLRGAGLGGSEYFGTAPDPTAIATLGLCLLAHGRLALVCLVLPVFICMVGFLTLLALGSWQAAVPLLAVVAMTAGLWLGTKRGHSCGSSARRSDCSNGGPT